MNDRNSDCEEKWDCRDADQERLIDLLVDGELDEARRRELLNKLDADPEGWKRCALAFLEAQSWRQIFDAKISAYAIESSLPTRTLSKSMRSKPNRRRSALRWGLAAAVLLAVFVSGLAAGEWRRDWLNPKAILPDHENHLIVDTEKGPSSKATKANGMELAHSLMTEDDKHKSAMPPELIYIPGAQPIGTPLDERWLRAPSTLVSREDREEWRRRGYEVSETKRLISIDLKNGQRVSIPLSQVKLQFVGSEYY